MHLSARNACSTTAPGNAERSGWICLRASSCCRVQWCGTTTSTGAAPPPISPHASEHPCKWSSSNYWMRCSCRTSHLPSWILPQQLPCPPLTLPRWRRPTIATRHFSYRQARERARPAHWCSASKVFWLRAWIRSPSLFSRSPTRRRTSYASGSPPGIRGLPQRCGSVRFTHSAWISCAVFTTSSDFPPTPVSLIDPKASNCWRTSCRGYRCATSATCGIRRLISVTCSVRFHAPRTKWSMPPATGHWPWPWNRVAVRMPRR